MGLGGQGSGVWVVHSCATVCTFSFLLCAPFRLRQPDRETHPLLRPRGQHPVQHPGGGKEHHAVVDWLYVHRRASGKRVQAQLPTIAGLPPGSTVAQVRRMLSIDVVSPSVSRWAIFVYGSHVGLR